MIRNLPKRIGTTYFSFEGSDWQFERIKETVRTKRCDKQQKNVTLAILHKKLNLEYFIGKNLITVVKTGAGVHRIKPRPVLQTPTNNITPYSRTCSKLRFFKSSAISSTAKKKNFGRKAPPHNAETTLIIDSDSFQNQCS